MTAAGEGADVDYGGQDDYGQVYDDAHAEEDPQVEEEAMQEQTTAPEDYADDEDLYNDIVPGLGQVDGVGLSRLRLCKLHRQTVRHSSCHVQDYCKGNPEALHIGHYRMSASRGV